MIAARILHDVVEDTHADIDDVRERFGPEVGELVSALTEDDAIQDFGDRKAALRDRLAARGAEATSVFAADKVAKVRELRAQLTSRPDLVAVDRRSAERLDHYRHSLHMLEQTTPDHPLVRQLRFDLEALSVLPPHSERLG